MIEGNGLLVDGVCIGFENLNKVRKKLGEGRGGVEWRDTWVAPGGEECKKGRRVEGKKR